MALSFSDREIRTTRQSAPRDSSSVRTEQYATYLQSAGWRRRRDEALKAAGWTCQRCGARKGLQVHHLTYERIGAELPEDLQVLCRSCHEGEHLMQDQREHAGIYVRVVSAALQEARFTTMADLLDTVKTACSRMKIRYNADQIWLAVRDLDAKRQGILDAPAKPVLMMDAPRDERPFGRAEAADILRRLNVKVGAREMPKAAVMEPGAVDAFREACGLWKR